MSGYSSGFWFAACAALTALGLVATVLIGRRRSVRAILYGAAWSLIPIAAWLTGSTQMFWRIGVAIGDFASAFAFSTLRWAGIGVTALIVVLFLAAGGRRRRKAARAGRAARSAERGKTSSAAAISAGSGGAGQAAAAGLARRADPEPASRAKHGPADPDKGMADIEEILRKRGI
jgi:hypothetical protein